MQCNKIPFIAICNKLYLFCNSSVFADMKYFIGISWYENESGNLEIKAYSISNLGIECNFSKMRGENNWQDS